MTVRHDQSIYAYSLKGEPPPKRWLNWWVSSVEATVWCGLCGAAQAFAADEPHPTHCRVYPSRDVAETFAARATCCDDFKYIGAFPEGERP